MIEWRPYQMGWKSSGHVLTNFREFPKGMFQENPSNDSIATAIARQRGTVTRKYTSILGSRVGSPYEKLYGCKQFPTSMFCQVIFRLRRSFGLSVMGFPQEWPSTWLSQ